MRDMCSRLMSCVFTVADTCVDFVLRVVLVDDRDVLEISTFKYACCLFAGLLLVGALAVGLAACVAILSVFAVVLVIYVVTFSATECPRTSLCAVAAFMAVFLFAVLRRRLA